MRKSNDLKDDFKTRTCACCNQKRDLFIFNVEFIKERLHWPADWHGKLNKRRWRTRNLNQWRLNTYSSCRLLWSPCRNCTSKERQSRDSRRSIACSKIMTINCKGACMHQPLCRLWATYRWICFLNVTKRLCKLMPNKRCVKILKNFDGQLDADEGCLVKVKKET